MLRKRNVTNISIIGLSDGIPNVNKINQQKRYNINQINKHNKGNFNNLNNERIKNKENGKINNNVIDIIPNKTRESFQIGTGDDIDLGGFSDDESKIDELDKLSPTDLSVRDQLWATNIFGFLCSLGMQTVFMYYFYPCTLSMIVC